MRKYIFVFVILLSIFSINCFAVSDAEFSFNTDEDIKTGKNFNIYLSVNANTNIGVFRTEITFDDEKLKFKSAEINPNHKSEYMQYSVSDGKIIIIYMNNTEYNSYSLDDIIKLSFSPIYKGEAEYSFECYVYEIGDKNANKLRFNSVPTLNLSIMETESISKTSKIENNEFSQPPGSKNSNQTNSNNVSESYLYYENIVSENICDSKTVNNEYNLKNSNEINFRQNNFYIYIVIGFIIFALCVVVFKAGIRKGQNK